MDDHHLVGDLDCAAVHQIVSPHAQRAVACRCHVAAANGHKEQVRRQVLVDRRARHLERRLLHQLLPLPLLCERRHARAAARHD
eukprot:4060004-Prymnesium_polylepis.1